jgi:hypothetical protein
MTILCIASSVSFAKDKIIWKDALVTQYEIVDTNFVNFLDSCYDIASKESWWNIASDIDVVTSQRMYDSSYHKDTLWCFIYNSTPKKGLQTMLSLQLVEECLSLGKPSGIILYKGKKIYLDENQVTMNQIFRPTAESVQIKYYVIVPAPQQTKTIPPPPIIDDSALDYIHEMGSYYFTFQ